MAGETQETMSFEERKRVFLDELKKRADDAGTLAFKIRDAIEASGCRDFMTMIMACVSMQLGVARSWLTNEDDALEAIMDILKASDYCERWNRARLARKELGAGEVREHGA